MGDRAAKLLTPISLMLRCDLDARAYPKLRSINRRSTPRTFIPCGERKGMMLAHSQFVRTHLNEKRSQPAPRFGLPHRLRSPANRGMEDGRLLTSDTPSDA